MNTFDSIALDLLLNTKIGEAERGKKLDALLAQALREVGGGAKCPTCGGLATETNGASGAAMTYLCPNGHAFDAIAS